MELLELFRRHLQAKKQGASKATIKNYLSDVRKFIRWYENYSREAFTPQFVNQKLLDLYKKETMTPSATDSATASLRSFKRYESSLRKFFSFLHEEKIIQVNPFALPNIEKKQAIDLWHLKAFKDHMYATKAKPLTIKNYLADIKQFLEWFKKVSLASGIELVHENELLQKIDTFCLEEYKKRLLYDAQLSPISINRKLSSLRRYFHWAYEKEFLNQDIQVIERLRQPQTHAQDANTEEATQPLTFDTLKEQLSEQIIDEPDKEKETYSRFPPLRLLQKTTKAGTYALDGIFFNPLTTLIQQTKYALWKTSGRRIFAPLEEVVKASQEEKSANESITEPSTRQSDPLSKLDMLLQNRPTGRINSPRNIPKSVYSPLTIKTDGFSFTKKILFHLRHTRPRWYRAYHRYAAVHYFHFAILLIFTTVAGYNLYYSFIDQPRTREPVLASLPASPPKHILFTGKLTDNLQNPLTAETPLRFGIYNSEIATGSALLWQEVQKVSPNADGSFTVLLGEKNPLSQELFAEHANLYVGISVKANEELSPRQPLATIGNAASAGTLQGLKPITDLDASTSNVILALDSRGDLTIGGAKGHVFRVTEGEFTLSGQVLTLTTAEGSNSNVQIKPDGSGIIDLQKPIQNTSNNNNTPGAEGAVEIEDVLAVSAKSSTQSALIVNQNGTGDLISASASGIAKFSVSGTGDGFFAGNMKLSGNNLNTTATTFTLLGTPINLSIGNSASALSLGAKSGTTSINNSLNVYGTTTLSSAVSTFGLLTANAGIAIPKDQSITLAGFTPGSIPFIGGNNQLASDSGRLFWDQANSRLGLGTNTPLFRLDVNDSQTAKAVSQIYNTSTTTDADGMVVKLGNNTGTVSTTNEFIRFETAGIGQVGAIRGNGAQGIQILNGSFADWAEYLKKDPSQNIPFGSLVCIEENGNAKACDQKGGKLLGVASENPTLIAGEDKGPHSVPVGLVGIVKTRVSGEIKPGDMITSSEQPGIGVKATKPGMTVGRALEGYRGEGIGNILLSVHTGWYDPQTTFSETGNLSINGKPLEKLTETDTSESVVDTLAAGVIEAKRISVDSLTVASDTITIGGKTLQEYIDSRIAAIMQGKLVSPVAQIKTLQTEVISPLASDSAIAVKLHEDSLTIHADKTASGPAVASIDNKGNASFSGTLRAQKIVAEDIELSEEALKKIAEKTSSGSATYVTNVTNVYNTATASAQESASASATPTQVLQPSPTFALANQAQQATLAATLMNVHPVNNFLDVATFSAELAYVPNLKADFATFNQGLIALGPSSFTDIGVNGQLAIGGNMILNENSINTIGSDLNLQPLRQGNLSIMGGLVAIDTEGNLNVFGNATFAKDVTVKGKIGARTIAPVPNEDLVFQLQRDEDAERGDLVVNDKENEVVRIDKIGNVIASGSGKFATIAADAFTIVRGVQADTSLTETLASGSAGWAVVTANETERTIFTPHVKKDSLIYLSATSDTQGVSPYIARQTEADPKRGIKGSFTIQIPYAVVEDIKLNWWIVN